MVGISIKTETPDQCHSWADSDKRYLAHGATEIDGWSCDAAIRREIRKSWDRWAGNGLASKCGDDKDENTMIYDDFTVRWPHSIP
jgi:hypothetical protein